MIEKPSLPDFGVIIAGGGVGRLLLKEFRFVSGLMRALFSDSAFWPFSLSGRRRRGVRGELKKMVVDGRKRREERAM